MRLAKDAFFVIAAGSEKMFRMRHMASIQVLLLLLLSCLWMESNAQPYRLKVSRHRGGSSKFSLNPLKPLMNLMRQDPMKTAAQRQIPKYLPPPPNMYQPMPLPSRTSYGVHPYRPYPSHTTRILPPTSISLMPPQNTAPSSLMLSALVNNHHHGHGHGHSHSHSSHSHSSDNHYRPQATDLQFKAVRIPSKIRRPSNNVESFNIADSVVRQLLDLQPQQQTEQSYPSVLVIEDPDVASSNGPRDIFGDSVIQQQQKVLLAPPVHAELTSDSSSDASGSASNNPEVFVIVSKNKKNNGYYTDDKKSEVLTSSSSSPKLKKYKITSAYDEAGGRQVWIIKR